MIYLIITVLNQVDVGHVDHSRYNYDYADVDDNADDNDVFTSGPQPAVWTGW